MRSLNIGATGMLAQQTNVEVISNNIANMNTTAYSKRRAEFQDLLYQNYRRVGSNANDEGAVVPSGVQIGLGVKTAAIYRLTESGPLTATENTYDMAIQGKGYFQVELPNGKGTAYTRAGSFQLSPDGEIVNQDGCRVLPGITVPSDAVEVSINTSGQVSVKLDGQTDMQDVGQFEIVTFANESGLEAVGDNLFLETQSSNGPIAGVPGAIGFGTILQGYLETSNVNVVSEVTDLVRAQRAYEMNSKVIQTSDQMMQTVVQLR